MKHHVFLSYSRRDKDVMLAVRNRMRDASLTVWTDEGIEVGTLSWKRAIENAILETGCLVCVLSPDANQSQWVRAELEFAELHQKPIFLILARGDKRTSIPFGFATMQWIDIREKGTLGANVDKLCHTIKGRLDIPATATQNTPEPPPITPDTSEITADDMRQQMIRALMVDGNKAFYADDFEKAIEIFSKALQLDPQNATLNLNRGTAYLETKQYELAVVDLQHAADLTPPTADDREITYYRLGLAYDDLEQLEQAIQAYTNAIEIEPTANVHFARGNRYYDLGKFEAAIADYEATLKLNSRGYPHAHNNMAEAQFSLGNYEAALASFERTLALRPESQIARAGKAVTLHALGQTDEAVLLWWNLMEEDEQLNDIEYAKARFLWAPPLTEKAAELLKRL